MCVNRTNMCAVTPFHTARPTLLLAPACVQVGRSRPTTDASALALRPSGVPDAVRAHALPPRQSARVLMLGLGGGVIPGDILCHPGADVAAITAVKAFPAVARGTPRGGALLPYHVLRRARAGLHA